MFERCTKDRLKIIYHFVFGHDGRRRRGRKQKQKTNELKTVRENWDVLFFG